MNNNWQKQIELSANSDSDRVETVMSEWLRFVVILWVIIQALIPSRRQT